MPLGDVAEEELRIIDGNPVVREGVRRSLVRSFNETRLGRPKFRHSVVSELCKVPDVRFRALPSATNSSDSNCSF